jgi:hypothetical protein
MDINAQVAGELLFYVIKPVIVLFGSVGVVYAIVLAFRRLTKI